MYNTKGFTGIWKGNKLEFPPKKKVCLVLGNINVIWFLCFGKLRSTSEMPRLRINRFLKDSFNIYLDNF